MKVDIRLIPRSKHNLIIKEDENRFKVYVTSPAIEGRANQALIKRLAEFFGLSKSKIKIIKGKKSRNKIIEIYDK
jgi:hypothetical protein